MPTKLRYALFVTAGFALGLGAASLDSSRKDVAANAPPVTIESGVLETDCVHKMRPLVLRTGDKYEKLSDPSKTRPPLCVTMFRVNDVPVTITYEVEPAD